jgi:hypothetical protein
VKRKKYSDAALRFIRYRDVLFVSNDDLFNSKLEDLQAILIRHLFSKKENGILKNIISISFRDSPHILLLSAVCAIGIGERKFAKKILEKVYRNAKKPYHRTKACYFLGSITNRDESESWFQKGSREIQNFWSLLCLLKIKKNISIKSINEIKPIDFQGNEGDNFLKKAVDLNISRQHNKAIDMIYSLKAEHFRKITPMMIETIRKMILFKDKSCLFKIGSLMYKYTGIIIKECFPIVRELIDLFYMYKITKKQIVLCSAIIAEESKFYKHDYYNLDNGFALGIMQIAYQEAKRMCKRKKITYSKEKMLLNHKLNILIGLDCIEEFSKMTKNHFFFTILYYNAGDIGFSYMKKFSHLNLKNISNIMVLLELIESKRIRGYVHGVYEYFIIFYRLIFNQNPSEKDLLEISV